MTQAERKAMARELHQQGMTIADIARWTGTPRGTIQDWVSRRYETSHTNPERAALPPSERYQIKDAALAMALPGAWR